MRRKTKDCAKLVVLEGSDFVQIFEAWRSKLQIFRKKFHLFIFLPISHNPHHHNPEMQHHRQSDFSEIDLNQIKIVIS